MARLAIADPPYPPRYTVRYDRARPRVLVRSRARRYYGDGTRCSTERPADFHPDAAEWDNPGRHRALLIELLDTFDGFAIATSADGLRAYGSLPYEAHVMAWVKTNSAPSGRRIRSVWEAVIIWPPADRRARVKGTVAVPDVLTCAAPRVGFPGAKPDLWTWWVLDALGYMPGDTVADLFPGSGAVSRAVASYTNRNERGA